MTFKTRFTEEYMMTDAAKNVKNAIDKTADAAKNATDNIAKGASKAAEKTGDALKNAGDRVKNAGK